MVIIDSKSETCLISNYSIQYLAPVEKLETDSK